MTFLVQTLPDHGVIFVRVTSPTIKGEVQRIYKIVEDKVKQRSDRETIHVVMDITAITRQDLIPAQHYIAIYSKLYEDWHYQRTLVLWIAVSDGYEDTVNYMAQKLCLPVYVRPLTATILDQIDERYASTSELVSPEKQKQSEA